MEAKTFPTHILASRISLKKHIPELALKMFTTIHANRTYLSEFLPFPNYTKDVEDSLEWIQTTIKRWDEKSLFDYGIYLEDEYIGSCGIHNIDWPNEHCELGYWIASKYQGRGYMSEAIVALEEVCFQIGFNRIEIRCAPENKKSAAVATKNNYKYEGTLRQNIIEQGKPRDTKIFSKLKSEHKI